MGLVASLRGNEAVFLPLVFLHVISALAGFGSIGFAGMYASRAAHWQELEEPVAARPGTESTGLSNPGPAKAVTGGPVAGDSGAGEPAPGELPGSVPSAIAPGPTAHASVLAGEHEIAGPDPELEELTRYFERPARFWKAILLVPVFGVLALWVQPHTNGLDQAWSLGALLIWVIATLVVVGLVAPSLKEMRPLLVLAADDARGGVADIARRARLARAGTLASRGAAICDVLFFVATALMIWRP